MYLNKNIYLFLIVTFVSVCKINAQYTIKVDLSSTIRPVTHCASGSLYGMTETLPVDVANLVAPLKPHVFCQPPFGNPENQHPFGSGIAVSQRLLGTTGKVQLTLADLLQGWPYQWPGKTNWLNMVTSVINAKKSSGRTNYHSYNIWNEPNLTWVETNGDFLTECWKPTFDLIRALDPTAKICGPGDAYYERNRMTDFLTFCINNNCIPDYMSWHEMGGAANIPVNVTDYRILEQLLGIPEIPISLNEYCYSYILREYEGCPGASVPLIAKFERYKVESGCISWWFTNLPGRLGSLLTADNQKGGGWWLYKWYGDMTGNMVSVTPPNDLSDGIDGFACLDTTANYASICIGGNNTGTVNVQITGIPFYFGASVDAKIELVTWTNKDVAVNSTTLVSTTRYTINNGSITVPVNVTSPWYGYRIYITPVKIYTPPVLQFTSPANNSIYVAPASVPFDISVSDNDGTVAHVDFFLNNATTPFHEEWMAPYNFNYTFNTFDSYSIKAIAYDNHGLTTVKNLKIRVNEPRGPYNNVVSAIPGTIQLEHFDAGGNGFAYSDLTPGTNVSPAPDFRTKEDVDIETCTDVGGGYNIGWATSGEWLEYTVNVAVTGKYTIVLRAACELDGRTVSIYSNGNLVAPNIPIPNTGGWQTWADVTFNNVQLVAGQQIIRVAIGPADYLNLNYITFKQQFDITPLKKGWNQITCPVAGSNDLPKVLSSIWSNTISVKNANLYWHSSNILPGLNSLSKLNQNEKYLINVSQDCSLDWIVR